MLLDQLGIKLHISDLPEVRKYMDYRYNAPWIVIQFRKVFKWTKISQLLFEAQAATLNKVLDEGKRIQNADG